MFDEVYNWLSDGKKIIIFYCGQYEIDYNKKRNVLKVVGYDENGNYRFTIRHKGHHYRFYNALSQELDGSATWKTNTKKMYRSVPEDKIANILSVLIADEFGNL